MDFIYSLFYFYFLDLGLGVSVTFTNCHISQSHNHVSQKNIKGSRIIMLFYMSMVYNTYGL